MKQYFEYLAIFIQSDKGLDGKLGKEEFLELVKKYNEKGTELDNPDQIFEDLDTDKSGELNFEEISSFLIGKSLDLESDHE